MKGKMWIAAAAAVLLTAIALFASLEKVPLDRVGVKIRLLGGGGTIEEDFGPGYTLCIPGVHRLELLDPTIQFFTMAADGDTGKPLHLRGSDQYVTKVDVSIVYRLKKGEAHRALVRHGPGDAFKQRLRSFADKSIWEELGKLGTEDFYNVEKRLAGAKAALEEMNADLAGEHIEVLDVLIRNLEYDKDFEEKLLDKQLLDQRQQLEVSKAKLEKEKEVTEMIRKEAEAKVIAIQQELESEKKVRIAAAHAQIAQIEADAEFYSENLLAEAENYGRQRRAEGDLLTTQAKAKGEEAVNKAYTGFGGELYLAKQMVENLEFGDIEVNTNRVNPFDVKQLLEMLGVDVEASRASPSPRADGATTASRE